MVETKRARFSAVSGTPMNSPSRPVAAITGAIRLTRMPSLASSTAMDLVITFTAPLELLYQVSPGRGRMPPTEPTLRITPSLPSFISGAMARVVWKIDFTFTANTRSKVSSSTSSMDWLRCVVPALLTRICGAPKVRTQ